MRHKDTALEQRALRVGLRMDCWSKKGQIRKSRLLRARGARGIAVKDGTGSQVGEMLLQEGLGPWKVWNFGNLNIGNDWLNKLIYGLNFVLAYRVWGQTIRTACRNTGWLVHLIPSPGQTPFTAEFCWSSSTPSGLALEKVKSEKTRKAGIKGKVKWRKATNEKSLSQEGWVQMWKQIAYIKQNPVDIKQLKNTTAIFSLHCLPNICYQRWSLA